jgi:hypothetical protein
MGRISVVVISSCVNPARKNLKLRMLSPQNSLVVLQNEYVLYLIKKFFDRQPFSERDAWSNFSITRFCGLNVFFEMLDFGGLTGKTKALPIGHDFFINLFGQHCSL